MRVVFMGTPEFSVPVLDALVKAGHEIAAVYCQPPRPAGRGKKERPTPVHARAHELGLEVRHPVSLKAAEEQAALAELNADVGVVVAYGLILPQAVLDAPENGCLSPHASLLPRWRGAAPIHRAIMAGDSETGICIMQMDAGLDTGPVLLREATPIQATDTTAVLHDRLSDLEPEMQPEEGVTYATKIDKAEAKVDWSGDAVEIDRQIRGLSPFPGAWCEIEGQRVKLLMSELADGDGVPGEALDDLLCIAGGTGAVRLTRLQRAGKGAQDVQEFLRGFPVPKGTFL